MVYSAFKSIHKLGRVKRMYKHSQKQEIYSFKIIVKALKWEQNINFKKLHKKWKIQSLDSACHCVVFKMFDC